LNECRQHQLVLSSSAAAQFVLSRPPLQQHSRVDYWS
jgi:hypothetical protein